MRPQPLGPRTQGSLGLHLALIPPYFGAKPTGNRIEGALIAQTGNGNGGVACKLAPNPTGNRIDGADYHVISLYFHLADTLVLSLLF